MSGGRENKGSPPFPAAKLWSKTSAKGVKYLTGRMGGVRVLVMPNRDKQSDDDPSYFLLFAEAGENSKKNGGAR